MTESAVTTSPIQHDLCGDISYTVKINDVPIDADSSPISFSTIDRVFTIYSEDNQDVG